MVYINNLTNAQAMACARAMAEKGRVALCNQIIVQLEARIEADRQRKAKKPRKRVAKTGELA